MELIINWINHTDYVRSKIARWYVRGRIFWRIHKQPDVRRTPWGSFVGVLKQFSDVYYGRTPLSASPDRLLSELQSKRSKKRGKTVWVFLLKMPLVRDWAFAISDLPDAIYDMSRTSGYGICTALEQYEKHLWCSWKETFNRNRLKMIKSLIWVMDKIAIGR